MFTFDTVALIKFDGCADLTVLRDCNFAFVGKIPTKLEGRVVPCSSSSHIAAAVSEPGIAGIITTRDLKDKVSGDLGLAIAENPVPASIKLHELLLNMKDFQWKSFDSQIDPSAKIENGAIIAPQNVRIGADCLIEAGAIIRERSIIGQNCRVGPGAVIGCNAFEVNTGASNWAVMQQGGGVKLHDYVEVEAKSTVVRATFGGFTSLGRETKLDCQVHIAHDCEIGDRVRIAACAELSGRVTVGDGVFIGPNATISNGLTIADGATVTLGAVVTRDVSSGTRVTGHFAMPHRAWLKFLKSLSA